MKIAFHGGKCCGIKTIHGLGSKPDDLLTELTNKAPITAAAENPDQFGMNVSSETNFFYGDAPAETFIQRLDRYIEYLDKKRPNGVIEIALCDYSHYGEDSKLYNQVVPWEPLLLERGFKLVTDCFNSNSKNRIFIYHRKTDQEKK
jgi:hypothetical protein